MQVLASSKSVIPAAVQRCLTTVRRAAYISVRPAFVDSAFDALAGSVNDLKALGESATPTRRAPRDDALMASVLYSAWTAKFRELKAA